MSSEMSGDGGQRAEAACACSSSRCFISARRVILRVPTPGAGASFCGARQVPRPLLLPCLATGDVVSGTTFISCSGVLSCARGVEVCTGSSVKRFAGGGSSLTKSKSQRIVWGGARSGGGDGLFSSCFSNFPVAAYLGVSASGEWLGAHPYSIQIHSHSLEFA